MHPHASKRAHTHRQTYTVFAFLNQSFVLLIKNKKKSVIRVDSEHIFPSEYES
jgi:hypothetical protein